MAIQVQCGANSQDVDFAGRTVAEAKDFLRQSLNIPEGARQLVTGQTVADDYVLRDGERLEFMRESGRKG